MKGEGESALGGFTQALFLAAADPTETPLPVKPRVPAVSRRAEDTTKRQRPAAEGRKDDRLFAAVAGQASPTVASGLQFFAPFLQIAGTGQHDLSHGNGNDNDNGNANINPAHGADPAQPVATHTAPETAAENAQQNPPVAADGELAFAARVHPAPADGSTVAPPQRPLQPETQFAPQAAERKSDSDSNAAPAIPAIAASAGAAASSYGHTAPELAMAPQQAKAPAAPSGPVEARPVAPAESKPAPASPLKNISLQVAQPGAQRVEVRVVQQSGEVRVAVRTGDSDLAHGLQQGLSDLVGRLQENGFRAEAWRPAGSIAQPAQVLQSHSSGTSHGDNSSSYSGGSAQQQGERRQNHSPRPGWVEQLESTIAGEPSQGASYGIGS